MDANGLKDFWLPRDKPWEELKDWASNDTSNKKEPPLGGIKQKEVKVCEDGTTKLLLYCGESSWRSASAKSKRNARNR